MFYCATKAMMTSRGVLKWTADRDRRVSRWWSTRSATSPTEVTEYTRRSMTDKMWTVASDARHVHCVAAGDPCAAVSL
jgi:hypothetical protein